MIIGAQHHVHTGAVNRSLTSSCNGGCSHSKQDLVHLGDGSSLPDLCPKSVERGQPSACPRKALIQGRAAAETVAQNLTGVPFSSVLSKPDPVVTEKLKGLLPDKPFRIDAARAAELQKTLGLSTEQLMLELIPVAKEMARPPISEYMVGAVGRGPSGNLYLGVNMEYLNNSINQTTHGEQFVIDNASQAGEPYLTQLAVSAEPCGHCRQFLNEANKAKELEILIPEKPKTTLKELLPRDFGPQDLGITAAMMTPQDNGLSFKGEVDDVVKAALDAANKSYCPGQDSPGGVAIQLKGGQIVSGSYLANAAYNPGLPPLQSALMATVRAHRDFGDIERVVLVEKDGQKVSHDWASQGVLREIAPNAKYEFHKAIKE